MNEIIEKIKEAQKNGDLGKCPRCGKRAMNKDLYHNALSRRVDIYICSNCGIDEAVEDMLQAKDDNFNKMKLEHWYAVRNEMKKNNTVEYYFDI